MILFGATLNGIILAHGGPNIPWWLLMLIGLALIWGVAIIGIRLSVRSDLALLTFEFSVLLALALTILFKGAPGGDWHAHVFNPELARAASAVSWSAPCSAFSPSPGSRRLLTWARRLSSRAGPCRGRS